MRLTSLNQLTRRGEKVDGLWRLGKNYQLEYRRRGGEEEILLTGRLIAAKPDALVFRASEKSAGGGVTHRLFELKGRWEADGRNRLSFLASRGAGRVDRLIFEGGWELDGEQRILCRWSGGSLTFNGAWQLVEGRQLAYVLDIEKDSAFRFRGAFQTPSVHAKKGEIRYQVGVEAEGKKRIKTIALFGKWKISHDLALEFETSSGPKKRYAMSFGATYALSPDGSVTARLVSREGRPLGFEVLFTRDLFKQAGGGFVRFLRFVGESAVEAGLRVPW